MATRVASIVAEIGIDSKKFDTGMKSILGGLTNMKGGFSAASVGIGLAATAAGLAATQMKKAVDITVTYADEVRQLSSVTNQSSESTSKLIQVMDDYGLSAQQAGMAARFLAKEGLSMNVETLAQLSDKYKELSTGQERAAFLMKNFGKAGQDFTLMMEQGSQAIMDRNGSVEKSLILSQKELRAAQDYKYAVDALEDAWKGVNVQLGNAAIPKTTEALEMLMNRLNGNITTMDVFKWTQQQWLDGLLDSIPVLKTIADLLGYINKDSDEGAIRADAANKEAQAYKWLAKQKETDIELEKEMAQLRMDSLGTIQAYGSEYSSAMEEVRRIEGELADARKQGYRETGGHIREIKSALEEAKQASKDATGSMVYDLMQVQMAAEGITDPKAFLDLQYALGLIGTEAYNAAIKALMLGDALRNIPTNIRSTVAVFYQQYGYVPSFANSANVRSAITEESKKTKTRQSGESEAGGGSLSDGRFLLVGDAPGGVMTPYSEMIDTQTGRIYNNKETRSIVKMGMSFRSAAVGGDIGGEDVSGAGGYRPPVASQTGTSSDYKAGSGNRPTASSAVIQTAQAANQAAQTSAQASRSMAQAVDQQTSVQVQSSMALIEEIRALRTEFPKAVRDAVQQVVQ